jgi:uncharacterized membrane protein
MTVFGVSESGTSAFGINARGDVIGSFFFEDHGSAGLHSFIRDRNGKVTVFDAPNGTYTSALSINDQGEVAGSVNACPECGPGRGFVRDRKGLVTTFDVPGGVWTVATSINSMGEVAGYVTFPTIPTARGFVRTRSGDIVLIYVPDATQTSAVSINASGDVAGNFIDASQKVHGFVGFSARPKDHDVSDLL